MNKKIKFRIALILFLILSIILSINYVNETFNEKYIFINVADTLNKGEVILRRFENLKLFKMKNKYNDKLFYNKDIEVVRNYIRRNPHTFYDSNFRISSHLKNGEPYESPFLVKNYYSLPDTIFANGYQIMYASDFEVMQEYIGRQIRVMSYKYKK